MNAEAWTGHWASGAEVTGRCGCWELNSDSPEANLLLACINYRLITLWFSYMFTRCLIILTLYPFLSFLSFWFISSSQIVLSYDSSFFLTCLFFKTGFLCLALAVLALTVYTRLASKSELSLALECWIKGVPPCLAQDISELGPLYLQVAEFSEHRSWMSHWRYCLRQGLM